MRWNVLGKAESAAEICQLLLKNRGLRDKEEIDNFLTPPNPYTLTANRLGVDSKQLGLAIARIREAIRREEPIVVYGDYDADGICSTAILWETLRDLGAKAMPFIPLREKEGYGLSSEGIDSILSEEKYHLSKKTNSNKSNGLIITVDSGIVAHEAVDYAKTKNLDVVIVDHHEKPKKLPEAQVILHTAKLCAAGMAYFFTSKLLPDDKKRNDSALELAAIATVTDLVPLLGPNRVIVRYGLEILNKTTRPGLRALFSVAGIEKVGTYEIGFMIGPRINASGRIENALTALQLLCTSDFGKAMALADRLNIVNKERQEMMEKMTAHAREEKDKSFNTKEKIIIIDHESYHQGVIGLIAGKLVEQYYLPAIVIAKGETLSKASARSISGFNIIEAIRQTSDILVDAGGHPMAAGFTIETTKISQFKKRMTSLAKEGIQNSMLERELRIDCRLDLSLVDLNLYQNIARFAPFGLGNPEPVFASDVVVKSFRTVGQAGKHLKLTVSVNNRSYDAIFFGGGNLAAELREGDKIQIAYTISPDTFNGNNRFQLKIRDIGETAK